MAGIGSIIHVSGLLYRDRETGRFLSWAEAEPIVTQARYYGYLSSVSRADNYIKAVDSIIASSGMDEDAAKSLFADYLSRKKTWEESGRLGDTPELSYM